MTKPEPFTAVASVKVRCSTMVEVSVGDTVYYRDGYAAEKEGEITDIFHDDIGGIRLRLLVDDGALILREPEDVRVFATPERETQ